MKKPYIGIDAHKDNNIVAIALAKRGDPELYGKAPGGPRRLRADSAAGIGVIRCKSFAKCSANRCRVHFFTGIRSLCGWIHGLVANYARCSTMPVRWAQREVCSSSPGLRTVDRHHAAWALAIFRSTTRALPSQ